MYYKDIIECIQSEVDKFVEEEYKTDKCKPQYIVGILFLNENDQKITLNCTHLGRTFSRVLFPRKECYYEYDNLKDVIISLYNQTM